MDALKLLSDVSDAYGAMKTLSVEATTFTESGDENSSQRTEQHVRFFYAAPDQIRYEKCGKNGMIQVADGKQLHTSFGGRKFPGKPRYSSVPAANMRRLHLFQPDFPFGARNEAFIYQEIDQRVASAQILRFEDGCHVVSVIYEPSRNAGVILNGSPVLFWVDAENRIVMRQQGEEGHRFPLEDEIIWTRYTVAVRKVSINEPLPEDTFRFTPPPDSQLEEAGQCGVRMRSGSGFVEHSPDNQRRLEHRGSHEWDGDTLVDHSEWKMRGTTFLFERRLTFSADGKKLHIAERITSPKGEVKSNDTLPVD